jgi:hypothetical protein
MEARAKDIGATYRIYAKSGTRIIVEKNIS